MTADLRELLRKLRARLGGSIELSHADMAYWCKSIDAALAEPAPEPFLWWVNDKIWQHHPPSKEWLEDCQESGYLVRPLYAAPPPASPDDARDAARLDWIERQLQENSGVYILPSGDTCFVQTRSLAKGIFNGEPADTLREAIDAAIEREGGA